MEDIDLFDQNRIFLLLYLIVLIENLGLWIVITISGIVYLFYLFIIFLYFYTSY